MKINNIYFKKYGSYDNWQFKPQDRGLHLVYGPNESGKTTLLEGLRGLIFGFKTKERKHSAGFIDFERESKEYRLSRDGKKLDFNIKSGEKLTKEPSELWWSGLDRKTYERIFGLTIDDMQGLDIINSVEVRTRFFGIEGADKLTETVKNIEKAAGDLLVSSAQGKRKINILLEHLKQNEELCSQLASREEEYAQLNQEILNIEKTEQELIAANNQWKEYLKSVEMVLNAWETYRRAEEAKAKMDTLPHDLIPDHERFMELDKEITKARENMRIWRGKEEGLIPENYSPNSNMNLYVTEIEQLYEQLGKWEQLLKECGEGNRYLTEFEKHIAQAKACYTMWQTEADMPIEVNWQQGEKLTAEIKSTEAKLNQWLLSEPNAAETIANTGEENSISNEEEIKNLDVDTIKLMDLIQKVHLNEMPAQLESNKLLVVLPWLFLLMAVSGFVYGRMYAQNEIFIAGFVLAVIGYIIFMYNRRQQFQKAKSLQDSQELQAKYRAELQELALKYQLEFKEDNLEELRKAVENLRTKQLQLQATKEYNRVVTDKYAEWAEERESLTKQISELREQWENWRPKETSYLCEPMHFAVMKREYDDYQAKISELKALQTRMKLHEEQLNEIKQRAKILWAGLKLDVEISPLELRKLYRNLQTFVQNKARYEQKEVQRNNYREEYDKWHLKEKELLLHQEEILQKSGFNTATEFKKQLISIEQYKQWESIYKQSLVQLKLMAPVPETYSLLTRRLREGNLGKWQGEYANAQEQIKTHNKQLQNLYEERGRLTQKLNQIGSAKDMTKAIQKQKQLEAELSQLLEDWAVEVLVAHFVDKAQKNYENQKQPEVLSLASEYLQTLTLNKYHMSNSGIDSSLVVLDDKSEIIPPEHWSSGLADQIYLSLRLSLAKCFGSQVEKLPIILDDILLRFDEERQKSALALLAKIAADEQVFLFSCQENIVRLVQASDFVEDVNIYRFTEDGLCV